MPGLVLPWVAFMVYSAITNLRRNIGIARTVEAALFTGSGPGPTGSGRSVRLR